MKKSQVVISELVIYLVIALLIIFSMVIPYIRDQNKITKEHVQDWEMYSKAIIILDMMATSEGYPEDWNRTNFRMPGLLTYHHFDPAKKTELFAIDYDLLMQRLNLEEYDLRLEYVNVPGLGSSELGKELPEKKKIISASRILTKDTEFVIYIWQK